MGISLADLRAVTTDAMTGPEALLLLFHAKDFHPEPGRRMAAAQALCQMMDAYLALKPGETIELALALPKQTGNAAVIVAGRGEASERFAKLIESFTTSDDSAPMLGFDLKMLHSLRMTNGPVGDGIHNAWWIILTVDSLIIGGRPIWDRERVKGIS